MSNIFNAVLTAVLRLERQGKPCFEPFSRTARYQIQHNRCIIGHMLTQANTLGIVLVDHPAVLQKLEASLGFDPAPYLNLLRLLQTAHDTEWRPDLGHRFLEAVIRLRKFFPLSAAEALVVDTLTQNFATPT